MISLHTADLIATGALALGVALIYLGHCLNRKDRR